jgi:Putative Flp pilus-assembly TadE/G-like/von Willebrand factor type A domain
MRTRLRKRLAGEHGQALILSICALTVMLGFSGLVIDIGRAYFAQRDIQSSADAAALAGAMELPDPAAAQAKAREYSGSPGSKNDKGDLNVVTATSTRCLTSVPGCLPVNAVTVDQNASVGTSFLKVFGVSKLDLHIRSTACSPCGSKPLDIMLVLDRTGSMCQDSSGRDDPSCKDLNNARAGMKTFMKFFDSTIQWIGLAVLPPAWSTSSKCDPGDTNAYNSTSAPYVVVGLSDDYKLKGGAINTNSNLYKTINCVQGGGRTSYATAIEAAQAELVAHGRPDVANVIVFLSDGAANLGPTWKGTNTDYYKRPCHQGVSSAGVAKGAGTTVYSIGYDLNASGGGANVCTHTNGTLETGITAYSALQAMASGSDHFYNQPTDSELNTIFTQVASDLSHGSARLIDNDTP